MQEEQEKIYSFELKSFIAKLCAVKIYLVCFCIKCYVDVVIYKNTEKNFQENCTKNHIDIV